MLIRSCVLGACLLPALGSGCCLPGQNATTGFHWSLSFDKPSTVQGNAIVANSTGTSTGVVPLAAGPGGVGPQMMAFNASANPCTPGPVPGGPALAQTQPGCTMDDVCRLLNTILRRLPAGPEQIPTRPMPQAP